jgi:hypothetical protein
MGSSSPPFGRVAVVAIVICLAGVVSASASVGRRVEVRGDAARPGLGGGAPVAGAVVAVAAPTTVAAPPPPAASPPLSHDCAPPGAPDCAKAEVAGGAAPVGRAPARPRTEPAAGAGAGAVADSSGGVKRPPPRPSRTSEAATQPEAPPATPVAPSSTVRYPQDFPDPFVYRAGAYWYALSTERGWAKVPLIRSTDLRHWEERGDALAALPRWSRFGATWAPSVLAVAGGFAMFYATTDDATGLQCLSSAFAVLPDGPFVDASSGPLVCQTDRGGSIDPSPFVAADGRPWLAWKSEGTVDGEPTRLWSQPLADDGRRLVDAPHELLSTGEAWEGPIVEAPSMFVAGDGRYHLLYSGNRWETSAYAVGHAVCDGPAGPCRRVGGGGPVLSPHPSEAGAGGAEFFHDLDGSVRVAYHAWDPTAVGYPAGLRRLRVGSVHFATDGGLTIEPLPA